MTGRGLGQCSGKNEPVSGGRGQGLGRGRATGQGRGRFGRGLGQGRGFGNRGRRLDTAPSDMLLERLEQCQVEIADLRQQLARRTLDPTTEEK
jgi:hypothetical protein